MTNYIKYISFILLSVLFIACSTKKNSFVNRNWHGLNTKYNVMYNGDVALELGLKELKTGYKDNFWEILPIERMQIVEKTIVPGQENKNPNFEKAETKATKAIQKHSMNIDGKEKNMQMDEAHLLLGKSRYYDQRFIPALEAFNYILYKHKNSNKINEAKVWREKTNIRLENDALAIKNLKLLLNKNNLKKQVFADANAILAQAYLNLEQKDSAIAPLKNALKNTKSKEEKARYHFILGQLYQTQKYNDSAYAEFQQIIEMKRKSPKPYVMQAHAKQSELTDQTQDSILFLEKYEKLFKDRENRPFHDILNYQMASFYNKQGNIPQAIKYYNKSLKSKSEDDYLQAKTFTNLATIYFDKTEYLMAGKYYDSTLTKLVKKDKEYFSIAKKRENLNDVIKYEGIVKYNDSILRLVAFSEKERVVFFENHIAKLKEKEEAKKILEDKEKLEKNTGIQDFKTSDIKVNKTDNLINNQNNSMLLPPDMNFKPKSQSNFYFYNPATVSYGKIEFVKKWGKRLNKDNWRLSNSNSEIKIVEEVLPENTGVLKAETVLEVHQTDFYIKKIPTSKIIIDSLARDRNFANFQLGVIYKEKFKEYKLSANKFETLLKSNPEERLVLPTLYNLYKLYDTLDKKKSEEYKNNIITNFPNSRYAQILSGKLEEENTITQTPEEYYYSVYKKFEAQEFVHVLETTEKALKQFEGDDLIPKFELLKANTIGKLKGVLEYKKALNFVALNYPNTVEGKQAEELLNVNIPSLEQIKIKNDSLSTKWKILYKINKETQLETEKLIEKIKKYIEENKYKKYFVSYDVYNESDGFVVIHGLTSKEYALFIIKMLQETKNYEIALPATVISSYNYAAIQINKDYNKYLESY